MPQSYFRITLSAIFLILLSVIPTACAAGPDPITWNITQNVNPVTYLGNDAHESIYTWWILFLVGILFFLISLKWEYEHGTDIIAAISMIIFGFLSFTAFHVQSWSYEIVTVQMNESAQVTLMPIVYDQPAWVVLISILMLAISVVNLYRIEVGLLAAATDPNEEPMKLRYSEK